MSSSISRGRRLAALSVIWVFAFASVATEARHLANVDTLGEAPVAAASAAKAKSASRPNRFINAHFEERLNVPTFLWVNARARGTSRQAPRGDEGDIVQKDDVPTQIKVGLFLS